MRTEWNLLLQLTAVLTFMLLRLTTPGWVLVMLIITPLGLGVLAPGILAAVTFRRRQLRRAVVAPFVGNAVLLVAAGLTVVDFGDASNSERSPLQLALGLAEVPEWSYQAGNGLVLAFAASLVWTLVAVVNTRPDKAAVAPPAPRIGSAG